MKKYVQVVTQLKQREEITFNQKTNQKKKKKRSSYSMNNVNVRLSSLNNILKCKLSMHRLTIEFQFKQCSSHLLLWDISRRWNILSNEEKSQAALNQKKKKMKI